MQLLKISLHSFRNYKALDLSFHPGITVFTGKNGIGKTTILEAVSLLGSGKSFRSAKNVDFIRSNEESALISALVSTRNLESDLKIQIYPQGKKVYINQKLSPSTEPLYELLPYIAFSPSDHKIIEGDSSERKQFLNKAASNLDWNYAKVLSRFNKALVQRNRILKDASSQNWSQEKLVDIISVWTEQMIESGTELIWLRKDFLQELQPHAAAEYKKISCTEHQFNLAYQPFGEENLFAIENKAALQENYSKKLQDSLRRDLIVQSTQVGPHKDEILLTLNGNKVKFYGSQGEKRTCALALRLGELALFQTKVGKSPILLFDDVSSELDQIRRHSLVELLRKENTQVLITATELPTVLMEDIGKSFQHLELGKDLGAR